MALVAQKQTVKPVKIFDHLIFLISVKLLSFPLYIASPDHLTVCIWKDLLYPHDGLDEQENDGDGDEQDADEVDDDARLYHLRDGDVAGGIDDGIRRRGYRHHETE